MRNHDWLLDVCQDLTDYAMNNGMQHLEDQLQRAIVAAKHDILMAELGDQHKRTNNIVYLEPNIAVYQQATARSDA